ncbi:MAG: EB domain-containing protein [Candidatus Roizmanbacteria bacterium]
MESQKKTVTTTKTTTKKVIPWWIWLILAIIIVILIIFIILFLVKSSPPVGGIGDSCDTNANCADGLTCNQGECICLAPLAPNDLTMTSPGIGTLQVKFTGIDVSPTKYDLFIYNQNTTTDPAYFTTIEFPVGSPSKAVTITNTGFLPGTYRALVIPRSAICTSGTNQATVTGVTVI